MQKAFDLIVERLEEESRNNNNPIDFRDGVNYAIEIVKQVAEEYNQEVCEWRLCDEEANVYDTTCRNSHILLEGSPIDNNYEYCPYCGKKIKVIQ